MCAGVYSRTGMRIEAASAAADKKGSRIQYRGKEGRKEGRMEGRASQPSGSGYGPRLCFRSPLLLDQEKKAHSNHRYLIKTDMTSRQLAYC